MGSDGKAAGRTCPAPTAQPLLQLKILDNEKLMFRLIRASFNQRRKTLVNGLKNSQELDFSKEEIEKAMAETGIPVNVRGEALTLAEFADLANVFNKLR